MEHNKIKKEHQNSLEDKIFLLRGCRVMLSSDLAVLYGVLPKVLIQAVKRNKYRFPRDFMFSLKVDEFKNLKSQIVTSSWGGLRRALPYAFTEQGVQCYQLLESKVAHHDDAIKEVFDVIRQLMTVPEKPKRRIGFVQN